MRLRLLNFARFSLDRLKTETVYNDSLLEQNKYLTIKNRHSDLFYC